MEISGVVQSVGRGKEDDRSYVRLMGARGEVAVLVEDSVLNGHRELQVGDRVALACDIIMRAGAGGSSYTVISAYSVHVGGKPEKEAKAS